MRLGALTSLIAAIGLAAACKSSKPKADEKKAADEKKTEAVAVAEVDPGPAGPLGPLPGGPVAIVAGEPITKATFRAIYDLKLEKYAGRSRPMTRRIDIRYRKDITERLVYGEVLRREAKALGVTHDPAELAELESRDRLGARDWKKDLGRRGESEESLHYLHTTQLLEREILEKAGKLDVTDAEIDEEWEKVKSSFDKDKVRVRLSQIMFETNDKVSKEQALAEAREVFEKLEAPNADFAALAKEHSDVVTRQLGGDLGIQRVDRMDQTLAEIAEKLEVGQVSEPFESASGIQIIKLVGRYEPGPLPKEAVLDQLYGVMENRKLQEGRAEMKKTLYEKYAVENRMKDHLDALAAAKK